MDFIKENRTKQIILLIILMCIVIFILMFIFPPKKVGTSSNDVSTKEQFKLGEGEVNFVQYIEMSLENVNEIRIPIENLLVGTKRTIYIKIYNQSGRKIYDNNVEFDSNVIYIKLDKNINNIGDVYKIEFQMNFDGINFYKTVGNEKNYLIYNGEDLKQSLINYQIGKKSALYRVWYPVMLGTLSFTLLGSSVNEKRKKK